MKMIFEYGQDDLSELIMADLAEKGIEPEEDEKAVFQFVRRDNNKIAVHVVLVESDEVECDCDGCCPDDEDEYDDEDVAVADSIATSIIRAAEMNYKAKAKAKGN